jgi:hypothetical protein
VACIELLPQSGSFRTMETQGKTTMIYYVYRDNRPLDSSASKLRIKVSWRIWGS